MQITRAAEYAIRGVLYLSSQPEGTVCLLSEISQSQDIPPSFLSKIFQNLAREGIVSSFRGTGGGFSLVRDPHELTLLEVVEAMEGQISLNTCLAKGTRCDNQTTCAVHLIWRDAQRYLIDLLKEQTFSTLVDANRKLKENFDNGSLPNN